MKKSAVISLLVVAVLALAAVNGYVYLSADRSSPSIQVNDDITTYYASAGKDSLLQGVTASDDVDGDVSDTLRVASVLPSSDETSVTVTYTAKDSSNNIAQKTISLAYDATGVAEETSAAETVVGEDAEAAEPQAAEAADPEALEAIAVQSDEAVIESLSAEAPVFRLTTHYVTLSAGSEWHYYDYIESMTDDRDTTNRLASSIVLEGDVDTNTPGVYTVVYHVTDSSGNESNRAALTVTVE